MAYIRPNELESKFEADQADRLRAIQRTNRKRSIIHFSPFATAYCNESITSRLTGRPEQTTCKRCVAAMMPYQREVWNAHN